MSTLAERLEWILKERKFSQRGLSTQAGLSPAHVGLILHGKVGKNVALSTVQKLAAAAGVSTRWLATGEGKPLLADSVDTPTKVRVNDSFIWKRMLDQAKEAAPDIPDETWSFVGRLMPHELGGPPVRMSPELLVDLAHVLQHHALPEAPPLIIPEAPEPTSQDILSANERLTRAADDLEYIAKEVPEAWSAGAEDLLAALRRHPLVSHAVVERAAVLVHIMSRSGAESNDLADIRQKTRLLIADARMELERIHTETDSLIDRS